MSQSEEDYNDHLREMLYGTLEIYSILVVYMDGAKRLFTFSEEEYQLDYLEFLKDNGEDKGIDHMVLFESCLDYDEVDYKYFSTIH